LQVRLLSGVPEKIRDYRKVVSYFKYRKAKSRLLDCPLHYSYNTVMTKKPKPGEQLDFDGQRDGEELLFVFRRHVIAMRKGFYLLLIPFAVSAIPPLIWQDNLTLFLLPVAGLVLGLLLFFYHFIMWYFTIYIVTDQRLRQITQRGLFGKDVVELRLSKIQNISYNIPGFTGEMFGFGTIVIQTFVGDLVINKVEHPDQIYNKLQDAVTAALSDQPQGEYEEITSEKA
jgi:PH (Pleckstrin Homology) domain-containing protein